MAKSSSKNEVFDNSLCSKDSLEQVESRLVEYKEREVKYIEKIRTLEFYDEGKVEYIETLKKELEALKQEKEVVDGKLEGLLSALKDLDNLIESQRPSPTVESTSGDDQNRNSSASENGESTDSILSKPVVKFVKAAERPTTDKVETAKKPVVRYAKLYRRTTKKPNVRGNQRNWNNLKSHQLDSYANKPVHRTSAVRSPYRAQWVPIVNMNYPPVNKKLPTGNSNVSTICCCCSRHVNTARPKAVINRRNWVNDVKASACWVWKPVKTNSASIILKRYDYVDVRGISRSVMAWVPKQMQKAFSIIMREGARSMMDRTLADYPWMQKAFLLPVLEAVWVV
uniref:Uncharacterized protein n=1 Tax=Tanacetum cinerariifolium TaxID=118510 RepID=A0A6L2LLJ6_TANCI|nr:hypothetical protein [Tanacetum cinerariifolium]